MNQALVTSGLNYGVSVASEFPSGETGDISQETNLDSNAFGLMLVELAGDRALQRQGPRAEDKVLTIQSAGNEEMIQSSRVFPPETEWRDNRTYSIMQSSTVDGDAASRDQERGSDQSIKSEIVVESDPKFLLLKMASSRPSVTAVQSDAEMGREVVSISLNKDIDPEISPQNATRLPDIITFAEIEIHLPPLIRETARDITAVFNPGAPPRLDESAGPGSPSAPMKILRINLHPLELGALAVRIRMSGATMQVEILAETRATAALLTHAREKLLDHLTEAGAELTIADLKIGFASAPLAGEPAPTSHRGHPEPNSGGKQQGGFAREQSDRREGEAQYGTHRDEDPRIASDGSLHDGLFI